MRYGSVCSGIEAATVAWHALGWTPAWFSEIEPFPCAVLAHHYPSVPNLGDMTTIRGRADVGPIDLLVGGTPCQSFSVAGLRKGLDDPRGNLALVFLGIADALRPRWVVWENVPGVLSSAGGRDFGTFLGGLAELGYGFAYRVLDAQYVRVESHPRAVPQRRRRVFVVGHLGDWRRAAAVLLERESLCGHPAPSRQAGEGLAADAASRLASGGDVTGALLANYGEKWGLGDQEAFRGEHHVAHSLRASHNASEDGTGRGTPLVVPILEAGKRCGLRNSNRDGLGVGTSDDPMFTLQSGAQHAIAFGGQNSSDQGASVSSEIVPTLDKSKTPAVAFAQNQRDEVRTMDAAGALASEPGMKQQTYIHAGGVRRLTPTECEALQGFPRNYTLIPYRGKPAADAPRYKALGNSMATNVMAWIGQRIAAAAALSGNGNAPPQTRQGGE